MDVDSIKVLFMAFSLRYPVGIQSFSSLREGGYAYVDKTRYISTLLKSGKYFFLSRPRRFGKSLFLSTLEAYFKGQRELFKGLDIDKCETDWKVRPVFKFSFARVDQENEDALRKTLDNTLSFYEKQYDIQHKTDAPAERFFNLVSHAYNATGEKVSVLIDEYDAPLLNTLENETLNNSYRHTLKSIFTVLKDADEYIHFAFVTGISRFSHTSLFSGANNLKDISLRDEYAAICGITEDELKAVFAPGIEVLAESKSSSTDEMLSTLKENYDGYHFSKNSPDIYNPFSILNALDAKEITNYWFRSGTASFLLNVLKHDNFFLPELDCTESIESDLSAKESYLQNPIALLYEAGYMTIKKYDEDLDLYTLGLPNKEVATSFSEALMPIYSALDLMDCRNSFINMRKAIMKGEADDFMRHLQTFLKGNPYSNTELAERETYFKNNIYIVCKALGFMPRNEEETCNSRMDIMLRTRRFIYIFELKTDGKAEKGMEQIEEKGYALPYLDEGKTIIKIAANYSSQDNNIDSWLINTEK